MSFTKEQIEAAAREIEAARGDWPDAPLVDVARAALKAALAAGATLAPASGMPVPGGWKLVPIEPTHEMFLAAHDLNNAKNAQFVSITYGEIWQAMLAAAPTKPTSEMRDLLIEAQVFLCGELDCYKELGLVGFYIEDLQSLLAKINTVLARDKDQSND